MRDRSKYIINKFASKVGISIYKRRLEGNFYDPVTGINSPKFEDTPVMIAFDNDTDKSFPDIDHRNGECIAYISGQDLSYKPKKNDIIQSFDNINFIVVEIKTDMYNYLYTLLLKMINDDIN